MSRPKMTDEEIRISMRKAADKRTAKPQVDVPIDEYADHLTAFDKIAIGKQLRANGIHDEYADLDMTLQWAAAAWVYDRQEGGQKRSMKDFLSMSERDLMYFYMDARELVNEDLGMGKDSSSESEET